MIEDFLATSFTTENSTIVTFESVVELKFVTIGDHSIIGALSTFTNGKFNMVKGMPVKITAKECWYQCLAKNMQDLMAMEPASIELNIERFI